MPSFLYHLKFELYPYESPKPTSTSIKPADGKEEGIWVPPKDSDIFDTSAWPSHKLAAGAHSREGGSSWRENRKSLRGGIDRGVYHDIQSRGAVIDCGPTRGSSSGSGEDSDTNTARSSSLVLPISATQERRLEFPPLRPALVPRDLETARRDWRFGRVRVESVDMEREGQRPGLNRRESSVGNGGINAGLQTGTGEVVGRVTKARYEDLEGKNTEVGWGIVHLYRDGEETPSLAASGVEVYNSDKRDDGVVTSGALGVEGEEKQEEDCTTLCIPAVPSYLTPSDFLGFVGEKTREEVSHFRMVMTGRMNRYLVLMKFRDSGAARRWRAEWDGKVFNSMEVSSPFSLSRSQADSIQPETCHVTFIKSITFQTPTSSRSNTSFPELSHDPFTPSSTNTSTFLKPFPPPTPNLVELPTCPVCLERMDDTTGLLTILCQHVFHCACLQKWRGSGCPVCRHTNPSLSSAVQNNNTYPFDPSNPPFGSGEASLCSVCDCADDLWICLICGNVGCGRYKGGHAKEHWKDSAHNFALEIETQHVWDYAGDLWVHRLIRDKGDGKVVELPSSSRSGLGTGGRHDDVDMVPREKMERIGMEYTHLLTSQLESQRVYFEELVGKAVAKASAAGVAAASASTRADEAVARLKELEIENKKLSDEVIAGLEKDLAREKKKAERSSEVARGFGKSFMEEKKVSEGLMERIGHVNAGMMKISQELSLLKEENADLKEQNRDLLFSITAQQKLKDMEGEEGVLQAGELEGGTVSLPPEKTKGKGKGRGK
jgi:BRCA1-associated protein